MAGRHHAEGGGDHHRRAEAGAVQAGHTAGALVAIERARLARLGELQRLHRKHRVDQELVLLAARETVLAAHHLAHFFQQRLLLGLGQVAHGDLGRIGLAAGAADGHQRQRVLAAVGNQRRLGLHAVDRIDHVIVATRAYHLIEVVGRDELFHLRHHAIGIDLPDTLGQRRDLGHADGIAQRLDLAVDIRFGHVIQVDQGQAADGAARQRLDDP